MRLFFLQSLPSVLLPRWVGKPRWHFLSWLLNHPGWRSWESRVDCVSEVAGIPLRLAAAAESPVGSQSVLIPGNPWLRSSPGRVEVSKQKLSHQLLGKTNIPEECGTFPISWCKYFPQALVRLLKRCYWEEYTQHLSVAENPAQDALDLDWGLHIIRLLQLPSGYMVPHLSRGARTEKEKINTILSLETTLFVCGTYKALSSFPSPPHIFWTSFYFF